MSSSQARRLPEVLSPAALEVLRDEGREVRFEEGETIVREGQTPGSFYVVQEGRIKMCRSTPAGKTLVLALIGPGRHFCVPSALSGSPARAGMVAAEDSTCLAITRESFFRMLAKAPRMIEPVLAPLLRGLSECTNCIVEAAARPVETRLAHLMMRLADEHGTPEGEGVHIPLALTRQELSDMVGTTVETAIRVMSRWGKQDVVATRDDGFYVPNPRVLEDIATQ